MTGLARPILACLALCAAFVPGAAAGPPAADTIAHGKALVDAGGCVACHTEDPARPFAGGKRIETPFGAIYSPNLTPDHERGIGSWSETDFERALRLGIAPDGSRYYPVFPYPDFTKLTRDDILAIRAYLATLTPFADKPPPNELRFPANYRPVMRLWNYFFFRPGTLTPDPTKDAAWNRGRYLVEGLGHCGVCHTPKNLFGADRRGRAFGGSEVDGWFAPRLDGAERGGLKSWSADDIVEYLASGRNARSHAGGPMAEVVATSTSRMSDEDVRAIAVYLKALPAGPSGAAVVTSPPEAEMKTGAAIYAHQCIACHEADGTGSPRVYPPLPGNVLLQAADPLSTLRVILDGAQTMTTPRAPNTGSMPSYGKELSDEEIAAVANYIRNSWGNAATPVTADQVARARGSRK